MKVVLELQDQPSNVRRITVRHDIVIGRGSDCNLRLSAPQVSRRHCFLRVGRDSVSVTDLDSSNGTFVDGKRITSGKRHDLTNGTQLALGPIRFLVHVQGEAVTADEADSQHVGAVVHRQIRSEKGHNGHDSDSGLTDASTLGRLPRKPTTDVPMNYSLEHGGAAAEAHETTAECVNERADSSDIDAKFSGESPSLDSRLEIIDFGRQLAEQPQSDSEAGSAAMDDPAVEAVLSGKASLWESLTEECPDDIVDVYEVEFDEVNEVVDVVEEVPEDSMESTGVAAENVGEDGESSWFAADGEDDVEKPEDVDDIDNELRDFLKGF